jgi:hypothetical protein
MSEVHGARRRLLIGAFAALVASATGCSSCGHTSPAISCTSDALCPNGFYCASGACTACATTCQTTETCVNGECIPASCGTQACPKGQGCVNNQCVDSTCLIVTCPTGQSCAGGHCYPADCAGAPCLPDEICSGSQCTLTSCVGVTCTAPQICADGQCFPTTCNGSSCAPGTACVNNVCVDIHCVGVSCASGTLCVSGNCLPTSCNGTPCPVGAVCVNNSCVPVNSADAGTRVDAGVDAGPATPDAGPDGGQPVDAGGTPDASFSVVCDGGPTCNINGGAVTCAGVNPNDSCQICDPAVSTTGWTDLPNGTSCGTAVICAFGTCSASCDIAGAIYPSAALNPANPCQSCQPSTSSSGWTNLPDATGCGTGKSCAQGVCGAQCVISGTAYPNGELDPTDACHLCNSSNSTTAWTFEPTGSTCAAGKVCVTGSCVADCFISNTNYPPGSANPNNPCQSCAPSVSTTDWSNAADGTNCYVTGTCAKGACTCLAGEVVCANQCVDTTTSSANCSACAQACGLSDAGVQTACFASQCVVPTQMPSARAGLATATGPDGLIYLFGGIQPGYMYWNAAQCITLIDGAAPAGPVLAFDPATNAWSQPASLPTPREMLGAVTAPDGRIVTIGGATWDSASGVPVASNAVEAYDTSTKSWTTLTSMPTARFGLGAVLGGDGLIYAIGGCPLYVGNRSEVPEYYCENPLVTVEVFDPVAGSWSTGTALPAPLFALAAAPGSDGRIYAIGGEQTCAAVSAYDPDTKLWSAAAGLGNSSNACFFAATNGADGRIYVMGGGGGANFVNSADCGPSAFFPSNPGGFFAYAAGASSWAQLSDLSFGRALLSAALGPDGRIYTFGGVERSNSYPATYPAVTVVEVYDPSTGAWSP